MQDINTLERKIMTKRSVDETVVARKILAAPHADTALCRFLNKQITALSGVKSQREIAAEVGYESPNIISMMKRGETKLPLDKVPAFAKALHVDPAHLFRLALEQQMPEVAKIMHQVIGKTVSDHEFEIVQAFRIATKDADPKPESRQLDMLEDVFKERRHE
jgi:transcriptional regulator with XRE-family HTH domain